MLSRRNPPSDTDIEPSSLFPIILKYYSCGHAHIGHKKLKGANFILPNISQGAKLGYALDVGPNSLNST
ncbi:hypothetical protein IEQ34_000053 [Dendrobium chrysotoxum]|uniref:Uncharacterized protein n=1 Tax=Dendrobium chrysotoxum TaxID=161865 RepID=A0AAV7HSV8_DENCH|nr:hypothetical protein IEQ34_000053 [Dendrobium chrysotoxum]